MARLRSGEIGQFAGNPNARKRRLKQAFHFQRQIGNGENGLLGDGDGGFAAIG